MNQQLIEVLIGIFQIDESTKGILCTKMTRRICGWKCNICLFGCTNTKLNDKPHYLLPLIVLLDKEDI